MSTAPQLFGKYHATPLYIILYLFAAEYNNNNMITTIYTVFDIVRGNPLVQSDDGVSAYTIYYIPIGHYVYNIQ